MNQQTTAFAPASIGNVAVGFDMLGLAIANIGDRVTARRVEVSGVSITSITDPDGHPLAGLTAEPADNTASIAANAVWEASGRLDGLELTIEKGIPMRSGMGGSAASAVAGAVAANALLASPFALDALLPFALKGERHVSGGSHADNVAPSLFGGLVLCPVASLPDVVHLPVPAGLCSVVVHPSLEIDTAQSRRSLADSVPVGKWLEQQALLAAFVAACYRNDVDALGRHLKDVVIEPQRADAVPCFAEVRDAALDAGALGCSLSGSGPAIFALCREEFAQSVRKSMQTACRDTGIDCDAWTSRMDAPGAVVEEAD